METSQMSAASNEHFLRSRGFAVNRRRMLWVNRDRRMALSYETVQDASADSIQRVLRTKVSAGEFLFCFSQAPEDLQICREILLEMGLQELTPAIRAAGLGSWA